jgi:hypothetical protein
VRFARRLEAKPLPCLNRSVRELTGIMLIASLADREPVKIKKQIVQLAVGCRHSRMAARAIRRALVKARRDDHYRCGARADPAAEVPAARVSAVVRVLQLGNSGRQISSLYLRLTRLGHFQHSLITSPTSCNAL